MGLSKIHKIFPKISGAMFLALATELANTTTSIVKKKDM
jgi:hypothetical protein